MVKPVEFYDALDVAEKVRVNAVIMYSMKQDTAFCRSFLEAVQRTETNLNNNKALVPNLVLSALGSNRNEAYQQVIDSLRSKLAQELKENPKSLPALQPGNNNEFDLEAQKTVFRTTRGIKDVMALQKHMDSASVNLVEVRKESLEGAGYKLPQIETDKLLSDSKPVVDLIHQMRSVLVKVRSEMIGSVLGASGVSLAEGSATAHAPSQQGGRAIG